MFKQHYQNLPLCCENCHYLAHIDSEISMHSYPYCDIGMWFPVKKKTCKRQKPKCNHASLYPKKVNMTNGVCKLCGMPVDYKTRKELQI